MSNIDWNPGGKSIRSHKGYHWSIQSGKKPSNKSATHYLYMTSDAPDDLKGDEISIGISGGEVYITPEVEKVGGNRIPLNKRGDGTATFTRKSTIKAVVQSFIGDKPMSGGCYQFKGKFKPVSGSTVKMYKLIITNKEIPRPPSDFGFGEPQ